MNYCLYLLDQWVQWLTTVHDYTQSLRLIGGTNWSWNLGTSTLSWGATFYVAIPGLADSNNAITAAGVTLADGYVAYVTTDQPFTITGDLNGTTTVENVSDMTNIAIGQTITGTYIPGSTTVVSLGTNSFVISNAATQTATGQSLTLSNTPTVSTAQESAWTPGPTDVMFARRHGSFVYVGIGAGQMKLHDMESKPLNGQGYGALISANVNNSGGLTAGQFVYLFNSSGLQCDLADATNSAKCQAIGCVMTAGAHNTTASIITEGLVTLFTSLVVGATYYLDPTTPGGLRATPPTDPGQYVVPLGVALSSTELYVSPAWARLADQQDSTYYVATETELAAAITATSSGGSIKAVASFTITAAHTFSDFTEFSGLGESTKLTLSSSGALTMGNKCKLSDLAFDTTALSSGACVTVTGTYFRCENCEFKVNTGGTDIALQINGSNASIEETRFYGVVPPSTGTGVAVALNAAECYIAPSCTFLS
jgi:hypothetical protein